MESEPVDEDFRKTVNCSSGETKTREKADTEKDIQTVVMEKDMLLRPITGSKRMCVKDIHEINDILDRAKFKDGSLQSMLKSGQVAYIKGTKRETACQSSVTQTTNASYTSDSLHSKGVDNFGFVSENDYGSGHNNLNTDGAEKLTAASVKSTDDQRNRSSSFDSTYVSSASRSYEESDSHQIAHIATVSETIPMYDSDTGKADGDARIQEHNNTKRPTNSKTDSPIVLELTRL